MIVVYATERAYKYNKRSALNQDTVENCVAFMLDYKIGRHDLADPAIAALFKNIDTKKHEYTSVGIYKVGAFIRKDLLVIYNKELADKEGVEKTLIVAMKDDINVNAFDPLQEIIDRFLTGECTLRIN